MYNLHTECVTAWVDLDAYVACAVAEAAITRGAEVGRPASQRSATIWAGGYIIVQDTALFFDDEYEVLHYHFLVLLGVHMQVFYHTPHVLVRNHSASKC